MNEEGSYLIRCETERNLNRISIDIYNDDIEDIIQQIKDTLLGCSYTEDTIRKYFN